MSASMHRVRCIRSHARKVFVRMLSSNRENLPDLFDPTEKACEIMASRAAGSGLEVLLDQSGLRVPSESAELVLKKFENAGMLAYRFFLWAQKQRNFSHSVNAYHTMIGSLAKIRQYRIMWDLVSVMQRERLLNVETFCIIMRRYARAQKVEETMYTFNVMDKFGVSPNLAAFNGLLGALCKSKNVRKAQEVFDEMSHQFKPDAKTYSILLEGWGRAPDLTKMREVHRKMIKEGCEPDIVTYGIMVDSLCKTGKTDEAVNMLQEMSVRQCQPTSFIYSAIVHSYGVEQKIENAVNTFLSMERSGIKPDVVVYNALVSAFCRVNKYKNAFRAVEDMAEKGINPDLRTYNIILSSMIGRRQTEEAYRVFRTMIKRPEFEPDSDTYTMMIKMFFETDNTKRALKVWKYMQLKQFVPTMHTFAVLINGLCEKGEIDQACVLFEDMIEKGIRPPGSTFGKLRHLLLKEGREDVLKFLVGKMNDLVQDSGFDE
ncbi:pentatricopeptide repeat-containing protein At1g77360, mitochondrial-like [Carex rostrata]